MGSLFSKSNDDDPMNNTNTINNTTTIEEEVLQTIRFINFKHLKQLSSFPRYPENANICVNIDDIDRSKSLFIFISHNWLRGWSGAPDYDDRPHPDNASHDKFQLIVGAIDKYLTKQAPSMEVYVWIDYGCINQDFDPAGELKQLDKIIQSCDMVLTVIADSYFNEWESWKLPTRISNYFTEYKAKAWHDGNYAYLNRCWCRVEMMYAANIPLSSDIDYRAKHFKAGLLQAVEKNRRPHYVYGTREKMINGPPRSLPPMRNKFFEEYNPLLGKITEKSDLKKIKELVQALQPYIDANKATEGYVGKRNAAGQRHGRGTLTYDDGDIYVGEFKDGKMNGKGTYTYSNGEMYVGEWVDGKRQGKGTLKYASGSVYIGEYKDDMKNGQGTLKYASGAVYIGEYKDGMKNGHGTYIFANGNEYVGEFEDDNMKGQGTCTYDNGDVYVGEFEDNKRNGYGTQSFFNGDVYVGEWQYDEIIGQGIFTYANGNVEEGNFFYGKFVC